MPNGPILIAQRYFPNEPRNASDGISGSALVTEMQDAADGTQGHFPSY